jgi:hypothetical protein
VIAGTLILLAACRLFVRPRRPPPPRRTPMKLLIIVATLGLATFVVLRRRNPELAERVEGAVKDAAGAVTDEAPGDIASRVRDKAKGLVG